MDQQSLFWVSLIIQEDEKTKPWLCSKSTGYLTIEEAHKEIQFMKEHDRVLSAWINTYDENGNKTTVFHDCYIDVLGQIQKHGC